MVHTMAISSLERNWENRFTRHWVTVYAPITFGKVHISFIRNSKGPWFSTAMEVVGEKKNNKPCAKAPSVGTGMPQTNKPMRRISPGGNYWWTHRCLKLLPIITAHLGLKHVTSWLFQHLLPGRAHTEGFCCQMNTPSLSLLCEHPGPLLSPQLPPEPGHDPRGRRPKAR